MRLLVPNSELRPAHSKGMDRHKFISGQHARYNWVDMGSNSPQHPDELTNWTEPQVVPLSGNALA